MAPAQPCFDNSIARSIAAQSQAYWDSLAKLGCSSHIRVSPDDLKALLCRVPAFPNKIPKADTCIECFSTWTARRTCSTTDCQTKTEHVMSLRKRHPTVVRISDSTNFQNWEGNLNNGVSLMILGWSYIFAANLAERQSRLISYVAQRPNSRNAMLLELDYATAAERLWWKAILTQGWKIEGNDISPWAVSTETLGIDVSGKLSIAERPPSSTQAASFLGRFCVAFGLGNQLEAALAAAICVPLQSCLIYMKPAKIELPKPILTQPITNPEKRECLPQSLQLIDYFMTLSLSPSAIGATMWSVFWVDGVPCNYVGAWLGPIAAILCPLTEKNNLESLVQVLSFSKAAPLWVGSALLGRTSLVRNIKDYLSRCDGHCCTWPEPLAAAWTGIPHSFLDNYTTQPCDSNSGTVSRADVWRLRREFYSLYEMDNFRYPLHHPWPPFGHMQEQDVEFELRDHLHCAHHWEYSFWAWPTSTDVGYSQDGKIKQPEHPSIDAVDECVTQDQSNIEQGESLNDITASRKATRAVFSWANTQVEEGFSYLSRRWQEPSIPEDSSNSSESEDSEESEAGCEDELRSQSPPTFSRRNILEWSQQVL